MCMRVKGDYCVRGIAGGQSGGIQIGVVSTKLSYPTEDVKGS
jgi:hypothetical protein